MVTILDEQNFAFSLGATDYIQKPIDWGNLRQIVDRFRPAGGEGPILVVEDEADVRAHGMDPLDHFQQSAQGRLL